MTSISVVSPFTNSFLDYPDNESLAVVIYTCGCEHTCHGCHNLALKHREFGTSLLEEEFEERIYAELYRCKTNKVVISGGDPLIKENIEILRRFLLKNEHKIDVCIYTGYDIDYVKKNRVTGYKFIKCGTYDETLKQTPEKTNTEFVLASSNQKLYNGKNKLISRNGIYNFGGTGWTHKCKQLIQKLHNRMQNKIHYLQLKLLKKMLGQ